MGEEGNGGALLAEEKCVIVQKYKGVWHIL